MKSTIILAGGLSSRFNQNKMFAPIMGKPLISVTMEKFVPLSDEVVLVAHPDNLKEMREMFKSVKNVKVIAGGATRTLSVLNGLNAISEQSEVVAIHDGARPFITSDLINRSFSEAAAHNNAVPVVQMTNSVYMQDSGRITPVDREKICVVQTPQVFSAKMIKSAYEQRDMTKIYSDDSQVYMDCYGGLHLIEGEQRNRKVTYSTDLPDYRIGNGYDVHRFAEGRKLILGGVHIPYPKGLLGHSDADTALHAIMDSLLAAVGEQDIGVHFPDTDKKYKGISSLKLLKEVNKIIQNKNAEIKNITCVIMAEEPHLSSYIPEMRKKIADALGICASQVGISATTTEKLGVIGRNEAIAAEAASLLVLN